MHWLQSYLHKLCPASADHEAQLMVLSLQAEPQQLFALIQGHRLRLRCLGGLRIQTSHHLKRRALRNW